MEINFVNKHASRFLSYFYFGFEYGSTVQCTQYGILRRKLVRHVSCLLSTSADGMTLSESLLRSRVGHLFFSKEQNDLCVLFRSL